jgi:L-rhamnose mutarotase
MKISAILTLATTPETKRWWKVIDPCQSPFPRAFKVDRISSDPNEPYYLV